MTQQNWKMWGAIFGGSIVVVGAWLGVLAAVLAVVGALIGFLIGMFVDGDVLFRRNR